MWTHNSVLKGWNECLNELHLPHTTEPRHQYTNTEDRPDISVFDSETGQNLDLDVSLAHPWSQDIVRKASQIDGYAASVRERNTQRNNYQEDMRPTVYLLFLNTLEDGFQKLKISCSVLLSNLVLFQGLKISQTSKVSGEKTFHHLAAV